MKFHTLTLTWANHLTNQEQQIKMYIFEIDKK